MSTRSAHQPPAPLMTVAEVAAYIGVRVKTLYNWRPLGKGPGAAKVGRALRYSLADVDAWLEEQKSGVAS